MQQKRLIETLLDGACYPHAARTVKLFETHISWVLLAGRYAYKIKKAVHLDFLDFSSLEARHYYCNEEIRLNRRLAENLYLDVVPIGGSAENPVFGALPAIEYAVRMKRFSPRSTFDRLAESGRLTVEHLDLLAEMIAGFHNDLPPAAASSGYGMDMLEVMRKAFGELRHFAEEELPVLESGIESEYAALSSRFLLRLAEGHVRECHGDLHLGNIALVGKKPVPFDCIEFDPKLRWIDVMNEIAFPVMDLLFRDRAGPAYRFLNAYLERTGDYAGMRVFSFYLSGRAIVRGMVDAIRAGSCNASCRRHLALARGFMKKRRSCLVITHGLPASGKTTFSATAIERLLAIRIRSDVERKRLAGLSMLEKSRSGTDAGIYTPEFSQSVYSRLLELSRMLLECGFPVIVDAAFLEARERNRFRSLAEELSVPFAIASMHADRLSLASRIVSREKSGIDASEADLAVLEAKASSQAPLASDERDRVATFDDAADESGWKCLMGCLERQDGLC